MLGGVKLAIVAAGIDPDYDVISQRNPA